MWANAMLAVRAPILVSYSVRKLFEAVKTTGYFWVMLRCAPEIYPRFLLPNPVHELLFCEDGKRRVQEKTVRKAPEFRGHFAQQFLIHTYGVSRDKETSEGKLRADHGVRTRLRRKNLLSAAPKLVKHNDGSRCLT